MPEHPAVCAYIGRALIERTPGTVRFFRALIDGPLLDEGNLDRWVNANVELLKKGIYR